jgi:transcriptional regulator with XRE-family HTH domain
LTEPMAERGKLRTDLQLREAIGRRMRQAREQAGLSADYTSKKLRVSTTMVANWEIGRSFPSPEHFTSFLRLCKSDADWLLGNRPEGIDSLEEMELLGYYRRLEPRYRRALREVAQAMLYSDDDSDEEADSAS